MKKAWLIYRPTWLPISIRLDARTPGVVLALAGLILTVLVLYIGTGDYHVSPLNVVKTLLRLETGNPNDAMIVNTLRLPRALTAILAGMALALAGTIMQGLTRNPLADPSIIGINAGASLAAVTVIVLVPAAPSALLPAAAFVGALVMAIVIYGLAWQGGSAPARLILVGIGLAAFAGAGTTLMITFGNIIQVSRALIWLAGSVYGRGWEHLVPMLPWVVGGTLVTLVCTRDLNVFQLGESMARGLGSPVEWRRGALLLACVALAGSAVATAGTIAFTGLIAPHIARRLVGTAQSGLVPASALVGGLMVLAADFAGRTLFTPYEIPCGIITAAIGAPYFMILLYRSRTI